MPNIWNRVYSFDSITVRVVACNLNEIFFFKNKVKNCDAHSSRLRKHFSVYFSQFFWNAVLQWNLYNIWIYIVSKWVTRYSQSVDIDFHIHKKKSLTPSLCVVFELNRWMEIVNLWDIKCFGFFYIEISIFSGS